MDKFTDKINEAREFKTFEELLTYRKCVLENGYWNCPGNLAIPERLQHLFVKKGKLVCKFGTIGGKFTFRAEQAQHKNTNADRLTSLEGMPLEIKDRLSLDWQKGIESAIGCPQKVGGVVSFRGCRLTSLEGLPATCEDLLLQSNQFKNLKGLTCSPRGGIDTSYGRLTSLEGLSQNITCTTFDFSNNKVTNLSGIDRIKAGFYGFRDTRLPSFYNDFISSYYQSKGNVFLELLQYMMNNSLQGEIDNQYWPEGFLNDNLRASAKTIGKFKL